MLLDDINFKLELNEPKVVDVKTATHSSERTSTRKVSKSISAVREPLASGDFPSNQNLGQTLVS